MTGIDELKELARIMAGARGINSPRVSVEDFRLIIQFDTTSVEKKTFEVSLELNKGDTFSALEPALNLLTANALTALTA